MSRVARIIMPGVPHHVTQRGNRKGNVFFSDDDYSLYRHLMHKYAAEFNIQLEAYCLMPNHVHMVAIPNDLASLAEFLKLLHGRYAVIINKREKWVGHLWQGRFYSVPLDDGHFQAAIPYVENNPVRANLVSERNQWPWASRGCKQDCIDQKVFDEIRKATRTGRPIGSDAFLERVLLESGVDCRPKKLGRKPLSNNACLSP